MQFKLTILLLLSVLSTPSLSKAQGCKDLELREKVIQVAKEEDVDEKELLSIIAHESGCRYYVVAWNLPKQPKTAQSKFFFSLEEAKAFAEELIVNGQHRVDVGIGQINNEANIKPRGWTLNEVLDPKTALNRVAQVLKAQGWANYHSSNPVYAKKWQTLALAALDQVLSGRKESSWKCLKAPSLKKQSSLIVFNSLANSNAPPIENNPFKIQIIPKKLPLLITRTRRESTDPPWIIYGKL